VKAGTIIPKQKGSLEIMDMDIPEISENEVLVKVKMLGLDGTDKELGNGLYGEAPKGQGFLIPGHESIGTVEKVGSAVNGISVGDTVVATVRRPDDCINCKSGESDMCIKGDYLERGIKGENGYMAEYYKEKQEYLVKIPESISEAAVMLEPLSIAEKAVKQVFEVQKRMVWQPKNAIVLGTGTVGLFAAMILRLNGIDVVSVDRTENNPIKDNIYSKMGITHINSMDTPIEELPAKLGKRIDIAVELTGSPKAVASALNLPSINGVLCLLSVTGESYSENIDIGEFNYNMVLGNKVVVGSVNSNISHFIKGVQDMASIESSNPGLLKSMITRRIRLEDFSYDMLSDREQIKNVIVMG
jgi:threonine dehydrogenase-like Zn-dependent dehydrogenase